MQKQQQHFEKCLFQIKIHFQIHYRPVYLCIWKTTQLNFISNHIIIYFVYFNLNKKQNFHFFEWITNAKFTQTFLIKDFSKFNRWSTQQNNFSLLFLCEWAMHGFVFNLKCRSKVMTTFIVPFVLTISC